MPDTDELDAAYRAQVAGADPRFATASDLSSCGALEL